MMFPVICWLKVRMNTAMDNLTMIASPGLSTTKGDSFQNARVAELTPTSVTVVNITLTEAALVPTIGTIPVTAPQIIAYIPLTRRPA